MSPVSSVCTLLAIIMLALSACRKPDSITVTEVPKPPKTSTLPLTPSMTVDLPIPHWNVPTHWQPTKGNPLRKGSWRIITPDGQLDISVTAFPGEAGGLLANLNRWLTQIQASPIDEADLARLQADSVCEIDGKPALRVHLEGPDEAIEAIVLTLEEASWFFKMKGPKELVDAQKASFEAFLSSIDLSPSL